MPYIQSWFDNVLAALKQANKNTARRESKVDLPSAELARRRRLENMSLASAGYRLDLLMVEVYCSLPQKKSWRRRLL